MSTAILYVFRVTIGHQRDAMHKDKSGKIYRDMRVDKNSRSKCLRELKGVLKLLPSLGSEIESFKQDMKEVLRKQPYLPKGNKRV
jgi:hypothetical protein